MRGSLALALLVSAGMLARVDEQEPEISADDIKLYPAPKYRRDVVCTRTMREPHDWPLNPFVSRQVRRARERAAKKHLR